jgi:hypothetical protein
MDKTSIEKYAESIKYLISNDVTINKFSKFTGFNASKSGRILRAFYKYNLIHISDWEQDRRGRDSIKIYKWGKGKDAKRFKMTDAEKQRRRRELLRKIKHPVSLLRPLSAGL